MTPLDVKGEVSRYLRVTYLAEPGTQAAFVVRDDPTHPAISCAREYVQANGTLGTSPHCHTVDSQCVLTVHLHDFEIRPATTYYVEVASGLCNNPGTCTVSGTTWKWGDLNNDNQVNLDDILCMLTRFSGHCGMTCPQPPAYDCLYSTDLQGIADCIPNGIINADDLLALLSAYGAGQFCQMPVCYGTCPQ